jgi:hypothetical protein
MRCFAAGLVHVMAMNSKQTKIWKEDTVAYLTTTRKTKVQMERYYQNRRRKQSGKVWTGCIWLRIGTSGGFHKRWGIS